jgi:CBS domain containing-hemolysin-like protein
METVINSAYSRLPVYQHSVDNILGVLYLNHFFKAVSGTERVDIRALLLPPCFVYKTLKLPAVLAEMKRRKQHLAIVTDEYGGSMGVVSMEDVFEELVGEIWDETDEYEPEVIEHADDLFEVDGDMSMGDFLEMLERDPDSLDTESSTVGGWTIENFGHFPVEGESFVYENLTACVLVADGQRVEKVLIKVDKK